MPNLSAALFYHIWSPGNSDIWRMLVDEQLRRIEESGLIYHADVMCCISGSQHKAIEHFVSGYPWLNVLRSTADESEYEGLTLTALHDTCSNRPDLQAVGYMHTKGIRHFATASPQSFRAVNSWRHFLDWGVVDRWRDAWAHLRDADIVGVNYRTEPWPHFSGNYWWARPEYISRLPRPEVGRLGLAHEIDADAATQERVSYERWVGSQQHKAFSFYGYPFRIPHKDRNFGYDMYREDIASYYRSYGR